MKILITGGTGLLGSELKKKWNTNEVIYCGREISVEDAKKVSQKLYQEMPDIVLHLAAVTDSNYVLNNRQETISTNIIGTANVAKWCIQNAKRMVFVSTDYVYNGNIKGEHNEEESLKPENLYAASKLAGEYCVKFVTNHCIIRTSFGNSVFPHSHAYDNLYVSKDYVDIIAPMIHKITISDFVGIINVGTEPKSIYEYATKRNDVKKHILPNERNFVLDTKKYNEFFGLGI